MLEVRDLHVAYGKVNAVRGIDLDARPGKVTLVLGANGAGKTTALRAIAGLHRPRAGRVELDGEPIAGLPAHRVVAKGLSLVPQGRQVFGSLTVHENLRIGAYRVHRQETAANLERMYDLFPILRERRNGAAGLLSGGEQQMLAFGRALMGQPRVLLLDEPSMGLAPAVIETVMAHVRSIADAGIAVLIVEQNADAGFEIADDLVVLARGEEVHRGAVDDARSQLSVVRTLLGEVAMQDDDRSDS